MNGPRRALYRDHDFPPTFISISPDGKVPIELAQLAPRIMWKRASELSPNPKFIVDGFDRHDIDQRYLGDCWFLASAAALADSHPEQFRKVMPINQGFDDHRYTGKFRFNFWVYGTWTEVNVDDYLPIIDQDELVFTRNTETPNEFWPSLLEKAFAKLHGAYMNLQSGRSGHALVLLTGGIPEVICLENKAHIPHDLYPLMVKSYMIKTMMIAGLFGAHNTELTGLIPNHFYTISGFLEIKTGGSNEKLVRLRNPWGKAEWKGPWSDNSPEMRRLTEQQRDQMMFVLRDDGEFWMTFRDLCQNFNEITMCHLQPDALLQQLDSTGDQHKWCVAEHHGAWGSQSDGTTTAGGAGKTPFENLFWSNPQIVVRLKSPDSAHENVCTLIVSVMGKNINIPTDERKSVGFSIFKTSSLPSQPVNGFNTTGITRIWQCVNYRFRSLTQRFDLKPGCYVVIPSLFQAHDQCEFLLRVVTEKPAQSWMLSGQTRVDNQDVPVSSSPFSVVKPARFPKIPDDEVSPQPSGSPRDFNFSNFPLSRSSSRRSPGTPLSPGSPGTPRSSGSPLSPMIIGENNPPSFDMFMGLFRRKVGNRKTLGVQELGLFLRDLSTAELSEPLLFCTEKCCSLAFRTDQTNTGQIGLNDIWKLWKEIAAYTDIFNQFATGVPKVLDTYRLETMFAKLGFPVSKDILTLTMRRYSDEKGHVSTVDFIMLLFKLTSLYASFEHQKHTDGGTGHGERDASFNREEFLKATLFT